MKRDSVIAYIHMRRDTSLPLHAPAQTPFPQLRKYLMDVLFLNQLLVKQLNSLSVRLPFCELTSYNTSSTLIHIKILILLICIFIIIPFT